MSNLSNLISFLKDNLDKYNMASLSNLVEIANTRRKQNSAYFTNKFIIGEIVKTLSNFTKDTITILEPSVGSGNFLPILFKKYTHIK